MSSLLLRRAKRRIERAAPTIGVEVVESLLAYFELLAKWNQRMNLTARVDTDEAIDRLLVEPVIASRYLPREEFSLLDVGSGGGSPAIPMKLMAPAMRLWMVESKTRKSAFLREAARQLTLTNTVVESARIEDVALRASLRAVMDIVSIRAVKVGGELLHQVERLLKPRGEIFLFVAGPSRGQPPIDPTWAVRGRDRLVDALQSQLLRVSKP